MFLHRSFNYAAAALEVFKAVDMSLDVLQLVLAPVPGVRLRQVFKRVTIKLSFFSYHHKTTFYSTTLINDRVLSVSVTLAHISFARYKNMANFDKHLQHTEGGAEYNMSHARGRR